MKICLILTACINPNSDPGYLEHAGIRFEQYLDSINWYLKNTNLKIIFAENSGEDIKSHISAKFFARTEFLNFIEYRDTIDRGKGFKELNILRYVFKNSNFVKNSDIFIKCTGRLICLNINVIIKYLSKLNKVENIISGTINLKQDYADSRFFIFSRSFIPVLLKNGSNISYHYGFEDALMDSIISFTNEYSGKFVFLPYPPKIKGINGGTGVVYKTDFFNFLLIRIKHEIKRKYYFLSKYLK